MTSQNGDKRERSCHLVNMVKRCSHGLCNSDDRYPDRLEGGVKFVPFPKPKTEYEKCLRWIKLCGRPHDQLNPSKINKNRYVCTKHFMNQAWPTAEYPDPIQADAYCKTPKSSRKPPTKRMRLDTDKPGEMDALQETQNGTDDIPKSTEIQDCQASTSSQNDAESQTDSCWIEPIDFMTLATENEMLKRDLSSCTLDIVDTKRKLQEATETCEKLKKTTKCTFTFESIAGDEKLLKYYTGFNLTSFNAIFNFLVPDSTDCPLTYSTNLSQINTLSLQNQLFLTLCRLRNNSDLQDLGCRFGITLQVAGVIFNSWINFMFLRFGEVCIWPHRDVLYEHMPEEYKHEFPNTFCIVDCTELKIEKPSSLKAQSQTYSDYKSTNTLKALVAVDPRGSVIFSSTLFAGSMSDKVIFKKSGFQSTLTQLIEIGHLKEGDGIMADKGFDIEKEVEETGLKLNIPPKARSGQQMSQSDVVLTKKIAKHRVHVERSIRRVKTFKIISGRIPLSQVSAIDQIWYVCSFLVNFMPPCIKYK